MLNFSDFSWEKSSENVHLVKFQWKVSIEKEGKPVSSYSSYPSSSLVPVHVVSPSDRGPHGPHGLHGHGPHGHGHHDHPQADGRPFKSEKVTKVKHVSIQPVICRYKTEQNKKEFALTVTTCYYCPFFRCYKKRKKQTVVSLQPLLPGDTAPVANLLFSFLFFLLWLGPGLTIHRQHGSGASPSHDTPQRRFIKDPAGP